MTNTETRLSRLSARKHQGLTATTRSRGEPRTDPAQRPTGGTALFRPGLQASGLQRREHPCLLSLDAAQGRAGFQQPWDTKAALVRGRSSAPRPAPLGTRAHLTCSPRVPVIGGLRSNFSKGPELIQVTLRNHLSLYF